MILNSSGQCRLHIESKDDGVRILVAEHIYGGECERERTDYASIQLNQKSVRKLTAFLKNLEKEKSL